MWRAGDLADFVSRLDSGYPFGKGSRTSTCWVQQLTGNPELEGHLETPSPDLSLCVWLSPRSRHGRARARMKGSLACAKWPLLRRSRECLSNSPKSRHPSGPGLVVFLLWEDGQRLPSLGFCFPICQMGIVLGACLMRLFWENKHDHTWDNVQYSSQHTVQCLINCRSCSDSIFSHPLANVLFTPHNNYMIALLLSSNSFYSMCFTLRRLAINLMNLEKKVLYEIRLLCEIIFLHIGS